VRALLEAMLEGGRARARMWIWTVYIVLDGTDQKSTSLPPYTHEILVGLLLRLLLDFSSVEKLCFTCKCYNIAYVLAYCNMAVRARMQYRTRFRETERVGSILYSSTCIQLYYETAVHVEYSSSEYNPECCTHTSSRVLRSATIFIYFRKY
jgi:hypothetical protein